LPVGYASLRLFIIVPALIRYLKADIVLEPAHFGPFNLPRKIKRVTFIHDITPLKFPDFHRWHSQLLQKIFLNRILKKTDLVITNSDNTLKDVNEWFPFTRNKSEKIYPGIIEKIETPDSGNDINKLGISKPYFLYVGTIEPRKNLDVLISAFNRLRDSGADSYQLVVAGGKGWKTEKFDGAVNNSPYKDGIICTGYVTNVQLASLFSNAFAFVYPSMYEGFGLPVVEAMSYGLPVITARNSSLTEAGGDAAIYFTTGDPDDLFSCMSELVKNQQLLTEKRAASLKHAEKFSWNKFGKELWRNLEKLSSGIRV